MVHPLNTMMQNALTWALIACKFTNLYLKSLYRIVHWHKSGNAKNSLKSYGQIKCG